MRPHIRALVVGGPMYGGLYETIESFARREGVEIEVVRAANHPDLNRRIAEAFSQGAGFDLISTHSKFAPAQQQWLEPLDGPLDPGELAAFDTRALELARIEGALFGLPRNLDVKLLHYRTDRVREAPQTWEALVQTAQSQPPYGFVFPGKGSGVFGHFFELCGSAGHYLYDTPVPLPRAQHEAGRWALETLAALHKTAPKETPEWEFDAVTACFAAGEASLTTDWPGSFHRYRESPIRDRLGLALYPKGPVRRATYAGSHTFALARIAADRALALALLRHLTSVDSPRGLLVPVIHHAERLGLLELAQTARRLIEEAQQGRVSPEALQGGTFSLSNLGPLGIEVFTPILNPPQVALLGVGALCLRPVQAGSEVVFRPHLPLSLTFDHRATDGAPAARFLHTLGTRLGDPLRLLAF